MSIRIDKNHPLFDTRTKYPLDEMEVGDSFVVTEVSEASLRSMVSRWNKGMQPKKFVARKDGYDLRVGRVK